MPEKGRSSGSEDIPSTSAPSGTVPDDLGELDADVEISIDESHAEELGHAPADHYLTHYPEYATREARQREDVEPALPPWEGHHLP